MSKKVIADEGYLSVGTGFYGAAPLLYKTADGGETWLPCTIKTKIRDDYFCIENICYSGGTLAALGRLIRGGEVILTSEDGLTWR